MALLTAAEMAKLAKEGLWVKEKCDICGNPLVVPVKYIIKGQDVCPNCRAKIKGSVPVSKTKLREEKEMKNQKDAKKGKEEVESKKVGGYLIAGSCLADLYETLEDEKKHPFTELRKICVKHKKDLSGRLGNLRRVGEKKKAWGLIVDGEASTVQMKLGAPPKGAAAPAKKAKHKEDEDEKPAKKAASKKVNGRAGEDEPTSSKAERAAAMLVRRVLKSKKDWTRNKLTEHLVDEYELDVDDVKQALNSEIKAGGIEVNDGVLSLA
jgi:hypothetical protein